MLPYDNQALGAISLANRLTRELGHRQADTSKLVLAFLLTAPNPASDVLGKFGLPAKRAKEVRLYVAGLSEQDTFDVRHPVTQDFNTVMEAAEAYAEHCHAAKIGTQHLLFALIRIAPDDGGNRVLQHFGVDLDAVDMELSFMSESDSRT